MSTALREVLEDDVVLADNRALSFFRYLDLKVVVFVPSLPQ